MTDHQIRGARAHQLDEIGSIALPTTDPTSETRIPGPTLERSQSIRAGIDHRNGVAQRGERAGDHTGAAAEVDDPDLLGRSHALRRPVAELAEQQIEQEGLRHGTASEPIGHSFLLGRARSARVPRGVLPAYRGAPPSRRDLSLVRTRAEETWRARRRRPLEDASGRSDSTGRVRNTARCRSVRRRPARAIGAETPDRAHSTPRPRTPRSCARTTAGRTTRGAPAPPGRARRDAHVNGLTLDTLIGAGSGGNGYGHGSKPFCSVAGCSVWLAARCGWLPVLLAARCRCSVWLAGRWLRWLAVRRADPSGRGRIGGLGAAGGRGPVAPRQAQQRVPRTPHWFEMPSSPPSVAGLPQARHDGAI